MKTDLRVRLDNTIKYVPDFPKPGILFKDICPVFLDWKLCDDIAEDLIHNLKNKTEIDAICAIESRGFFIGILMANKLRVPLFPVRKKGKLPSEVRSYTYNLEYGSSTLEIQTGIVQPGWRVMVHDDILATGGTAIAAAELIRLEGGSVCGFTFIDALDGLDGEKHLQKYSKEIVTI